MSIEIKLLKTSAVRELEDNFSIYRKNGDQLQELIKSNSIGTNIFFELPEMPADDDYLSAKNLYSALRVLTTVQASDERIWIYLFYGVFDDYRRDRLKIRYPKIMPDDKKLMSNTLFTGNNNDKIRAKFLNYLSRLWWAGYFLEEDDEALLTITKKDFAGIMTGYFSSTFTSLATVRYGTMRAVKQFIKEVDSSDSNLPDIIRNKNQQVYGYGVRNLLLEANKFLNRLSSATIVDVFSREEIYKLVFDHLKTYYLTKKTLY